MVKEKIQKAKKPKYNTLQNVGWMVKIAWKNGKRVLLFCVPYRYFGSAVQFSSVIHCSGGAGTS
ncbi:MAG: hypothetical protein ACLTR4_05600 [Gallintestinimicrobium sp.]